MTWVEGVCCVLQSWSPQEFLSSSSQHEEPERTASLKFKPRPDKRLKLVNLACKPVVISSTAELFAFEWKMRVHSKLLFTNAFGVTFHQGWVLYWRHTCTSKGGVRTWLLSLLHWINHWRRTLRATLVTFILVYQAIRCTNKWTFKPFVLSSFSTLEAQSSNGGTMVWTCSLHPCTESVVWTPTYYA